MQCNRFTRQEHDPRPCTDVTWSHAGWLRWETVATVHWAEILGGQIGLWAKSNSKSSPKNYPPKTICWGSAKYFFSQNQLLLQQFPNIFQFYHIAISRMESVAPTFPWLTTNYIIKLARFGLCFFFMQIFKPHIARPCLVHLEIQKVFKIPGHIESYGTCMKH